MKAAARSARIPELPNPNADHYRLPGEDRPMPRTTSVIDRGIGKPFLTKWAGNLERKAILGALAELLAEEFDEKRSADLVAQLESRLARDPYCEVEKNAAADFGTAAHALVEEHLRARLGEGLLDEDRGDAGSALVTRAARLAIEWFDAVDFQPDENGIEARLWSQDEHLWSAGTADAFGTADLGLLIENSAWNRPRREEITAGTRVPLLVDLKTSKSIGVAHKVQTAAYVTYLVERGRIEEPCHCCILRVAKTEEDKHPVEAVLIHPDEFPRYGGAFRFIRRIYNFLTQEEDLERRHWRRKLR